ncbi:MAG: FAD-binding protein [Clostridia bacterium]|nr:FAD-binding protein [Clostridia bacterium]
MKALVLVKQVPDTKEIKTDEKTGSLQRDTVGSVLNEADKDALIMCRNLKEQGKIVFDSMTLGPVQSRAALRQALGYGAENAYHICDGDFAGSDVLATAKTLKSAIENKDLNYKIIFAGFKSSDSDTGHLPAELSAILDYTYLTGVTEITDIDENFITVVSLSDNKKIYQKAKLPVVISVNQNNFPPEFPNLRQMMLARKKPLQKITNEDLMIEKDKCGYLGSPTKFVKMRAAISSREIEFLDDFNPEKDIPKFLKLAQKEVKSDKRQLFSTDKPQKVLVIADKDELSVSKEMASSLLLKPECLDLTLVTNSEKVDNLINYFDEIIVADKAVSYDQMSEFSMKLIEKENFDIVLCSSNDFGRSTAATIAAKLETGLTADCTEFEFFDNQFIMTRPAYDNRLLASIKIPDNLPQMATVRPDVFEVCELEKKAKIKKSNAEIIESKIQILREEKTDINRKTKKDILFVVGNIISSKEEVEYFKKLADKYNADLGCTRPVVTGQLMNSDEQIGVSGHISDADLVVLVGVSGTTQTMTGVKRCGKIIAINNDPNAEVFNHSDYGIVDDYKTVFRKDE